MLDYEDGNVTGPLLDSGAIAKRYAAKLIADSLKLMAISLNGYYSVSDRRTTVAYVVSEITSAAGGTLFLRVSDIQSH